MSDELAACLRRDGRPMSLLAADVVERQTDEIARLRAERDKFEQAWKDVCDRYEALLTQLDATGA